MEHRIVDVQLPNGACALVRAVDIDGAASGATKTSALSAFDFQEVARTLEGLSVAVREALATAAPDRVTLELGLELAVKSGKLTGLVVEGQGTGSLTVTLAWGHDAGGG